ncbi:MAG: hypothetical protein AB9873_19070 [Syntrophobacteraceae bacterium]
MIARKSRTRVISLFMCFLLLGGFLAIGSLCTADDHKESWKRSDKHGAGGWGQGFPGGLSGKGRDKGNETTGEITAWSLGVANLTVALSILIRWLRELTPLAPETKSVLARFNSTQKKYLMQLHYVLNPVILLVAVVHWSLSRCKSTVLPEWGLLTMGALAALGIVLKFRLCSKDTLKNVYKIHTQPILLLLLFAFLIIGHMSMD